MNKSCLFGVLLALAGTASASVTHAPATAASIDQTMPVRLQLQQAFNQTTASDYAAAGETFDKALSDPTFAALPEDLRYRSLLLAGLTARANKQTELAHKLMVQASGYPQATSLPWMIRSFTAFTLHDFRDCAHSNAELAKNWPASLKEFNDGAFYAIHRHLSDAHDDAADLEMLDALFNASWSDAGNDQDDLWLDLVRLLLQKGDVAEANLVVARISSPSVLLSMRVDKQFDAVTQAAPQTFDIDRATAAAIAATEASVKAAPDRLAPIVHLQQLLLLTRQQQRALSISESAVEASAGGKGNDRYKDFDDKYVWLLTERSSAYGRLGQWDLATRTLAKAARRPQDGEMNVSQAINLGSLYARLGQPDQADDAIADIGDMSDFGRMQLETVKLRIAILRKHAADISTHMSYLRQHRESAIGTWVTALLLTGNEDEAAKVVIERLDRADWRNDALVSMQHYAQVQETAGDQQIRALRKKLFARPDVNAAALKVGRIEQFNLAD